MAHNYEDMEYSELLTAVTKKLGRPPNDKDIETARFESLVERVERLETAIETLQHLLASTVSEGSVTVTGGE